MKDPITKRITISRNVIFNEQKSPEIKRNEAQFFIGDDIEQNAEEEIDNTELTESDDSTHTAIDEQETYEPSQEIDLTDIDRSNITLRLRRNNVFEVNLMELDVPVSYNEAINSKDSELWLEAINEQLEAHRTNTVHLPQLLMIEF